MGKNKSKHRFYTEVSKRRSELAKVDNYLRERAYIEKTKKKGAGKS